MFLKYLAFAILTNLIASQDFCSLPVDRGNSKCDKAKKSTRYHFESKLNMCFPFSYEGCDGNENNFESESLCYNGCRPADQFSCPANSESKGTCHRGPDADKQCPEGTTCTPGGMLDYCCNSTITKEWEHEYNSKECENGGKIVEEKFWYGDDVLRGSHCDHKFCPDDSECVQGQYIARCCRRK